MSRSYAVADDKLKLYRQALDLALFTTREKKCQPIDPRIDRLNTKAWARAYRRWENLDQ